MKDNNKKLPVIGNRGGLLLKSNKVVWGVGAILLLVIVVALVLFVFGQEPEETNDSQKEEDVSFSVSSLDKLESCRPEDAQTPLFGYYHINNYEDSKLILVSSNEDKDGGIYKYSFSLINQGVESEFKANVQLLTSDAATETAEIKAAVDKIKEGGPYNSQEKITIQDLGVVIAYGSEKGEPISQEVASDLVFISEPLANTGVCLWGSIYRESEDGRIIDIPRSDFRQRLALIIEQFVELDKDAFDRHQEMLREYAFPEVNSEEDQGDSQTP